LMKTGARGRLAEVLQLLRSGAQGLPQLACLRESLRMGFAAGAPMAEIGRIRSGCAPLCQPHQPLLCLMLQLGVVCRTGFGFTHGYSCALDRYVRLTGNARDYRLPLPQDGLTEAEPNRCAVFLSRRSAQ